MKINIKEGDGKLTIVLTDIPTTWSDPIEKYELIEAGSKIKIENESLKVCVSLSPASYEMSKVKSPEKLHD